MKILKKYRAKKQLREIADLIKAEGEHLKGYHIIEGNTILLSKNISGVGEWFVITIDYIWYITTDYLTNIDLSQLNVITGGPEAIGWRIPFSQALANRLYVLDRILRKGKYDDRGRD